MSIEVFPLVYRCCVIIVPKQPLVNWINRLVLSVKLTLDVAQQLSHAYLVPDFGEEENIYEALDNYLQANFKGIFLNELSFWSNDHKTYPKMTLAVFKEWFLVLQHTMVFDMVNEPIFKD